MIRKYGGNTLQLKEGIFSINGINIIGEFISLQASSHDATQPYISWVDGYGWVKNAQDRPQDWIFSEDWQGRKNIKPPWLAGVFNDTLTINGDEVLQTEKVQVRGKKRGRKFNN